MPPGKENMPTGYRVCAFTAAPRPRPALPPRTSPAWLFFCRDKSASTSAGSTYICDDSNFLLTSVDLPVVSQVIAATRKVPMLGLLLKLEMPAVREILSASRNFICARNRPIARAMAVGVTSVELLDACSRLVDLLDAPEDIPFLSSLIQREIIYRLLRSPQGTSARHRHAGRAKPSHCEGFAWLRANLREAAAGRGTRGHGAHGRLDPAPSVPLA